MKNYAILTGDIIGSSKLTTKQRISSIEELRNVAQEVQKYFCVAAEYPIDIFRGDSWQFVVTKPHLALRIALYFRAKLKSTSSDKKIDTRIAIAIGKVDYLPKNDISQGNGEAFQQSGKALEKMKNNYMYISLPDEKINPYYQIMIELLDTIVSKWTIKQANASAGALQGLTQKEIAKQQKPPVTQQSVRKLLKNASWNAIDSLIRFYENNIQRL